MPPMRSVRRQHCVGASHSFTSFLLAVHDGDYPSPQHLVDCETEVVDAFRDWLDKTA
jgi:hypothetical protein